MLCIESFVSQLVHVIMMRKFIPGHGEGVLAKADIAGYVQHVVKFSAAGIRSAAEESREVEGEKRKN